MPLEIVRNDITAMKVDVIVNSAHPTPEWAEAWTMPFIGPRGRN